MKRKIAAILAADVAEYSRLVAEDEEGTLHLLVASLGVFKGSVEAHGGRIFNTAGDAILAEFQSAVEAVRSAIDIQNAILTRNEGCAPSKRMLFRMGISIGDVVER
jgi:class 3 adenylate cyclase